MRLEGKCFLTWTLYLAHRSQCWWLFFHWQRFQFCQFTVISH